MVLRVEATKVGNALFPQFVTRAYECGNLLHGEVVCYEVLHKRCGDKRTAEIPTALVTCLVEPRFDELCVGVPPREGGCAEVTPGWAGGQAAEEI
jgi:hypothetical protein